MQAIPALGRLRLDDRELQASQDYIRKETPISKI
jgi:hypothetical protein